MLDNAASPARSNHSAAQIATDATHVKVELTSGLRMM
jgi:hypothetical protein